MKQAQKRKIIIFMQQICSIGGAETWLYNLTSALRNDFDILVLYDYADAAQIARLKVKSERRMLRQVYPCDILLNLFLGRPENIVAKKIIQVVHSNYAEMPYYKYEDWARTNEYIFVSKAAKQGFTVKNKKLKTILENPVFVEEAPTPNKRTDDKLRLMSATRLSCEKGGKRMIQLCKLLRDHNIDFTFDVWTTFTKKRFEDEIGQLPPEITLHSPKLDLRQEMVDSDYVVQLSDCEAFCYTIHEALALNVPVIVTDWKGVRETVTDGLNGYIFNMKLTNRSVKRLLKKPKGCKYKGSKSVAKWIEFLNTTILPKSEYTFVQVIVTFRDSLTGEVLFPGQILRMKNERAKALIEMRKVRAA